jgi:hypothetical protein
MLEDAKAPPRIRPESCAQLVLEYMYGYAAVSPHDGVLWIP